MEFESLRWEMEKIAESVEEKEGYVAHYIRGTRDNEAGYCREPVLFIRQKGLIGWLRANRELSPPLHLPKTTPLIVVPKMNSPLGETLQVLVNIRDERYRAPVKNRFAEMTAEKRFQFNYVNEISSEIINPRYALAG